MSALSLSACLKRSKWRRGDCGERLQRVASQLPENSCIAPVLTTTPTDQGVVFARFVDVVVSRAALPDGGVGHARSHQRKERHERHHHHCL
jgi:hypothetical protein